MLAVQGPPGTGKTYAGSALIRELLDAGLRVGVTAQSHAVVLNLLDEVARPAWHKDGSNVEEGDEPDDPNALIHHTSDNAAIAAALASGEATLVGGTAWLWSRDDMVDAVDVLVIDEAGQFSLANAVAVAPAARSLVLLGDPQQLTQPTKAVHPYGSGVSALDHLRTDGRRPRPRRHPRRPRRLPRPHAPDAPESDGVRLASSPTRAGSSRRRAGSGSRSRRPAPCRATGCAGCRSSTRPSPSSRAARRPASSAPSSTTCCAAAGPPQTATRARSGSPTSSSSRRTTRTSRRSRAELPEGARVGTVDKFQGQQGAVVIYSMASTTAALAPRGVSFLYDLHRLNVAISRAKAMAVIVGSPLLTDAEVHTPEELRAVNALCRYVDEAKTV